VFFFIDDDAWLFLNKITRERESKDMDNHVEVSWETRDRSSTPSSIASFIDLNPD